MMQGIYGIISNRPADINLKELDLMSSFISLEGGNGKHNISLHEDGVYIGWDSHEGGFSDCLPIKNEKKDCILFYRGENFNDPDLLDELKKKNHIYDRKNASYLVHMYEELGEEFFGRLNGGFHGLIVDKRKNKILLFCDRFGIQKIYYYENRDAFYFSNQAKPLLKTIAGCPEIETQSFAELLRYNCVFDNRTLFKNISTVPPGSYWCFGKDKNVKKSKYFNTSDLEDQTLLESEFHYEKLLYTLQKLLKRYFKAEENVAICIDDDLGVRIILANAMYGPGKVKCFAVNNPHSSEKTRQTAIEIAKISGQVLEVVDIDDDFFCNFNEYAEKSYIVSSGICDINGVVEFYLHNKIKDFAPIKVATDHDAAILRKNAILQPYTFNQNILSMDFKNLLERTNNCRDKKIELAADLSFQVNEGIPFGGSMGFAICQSQMVIRYPFLDNDLVGLMFRGIDDITRRKETSLRLIRDGNRSIADIGRSVTAKGLFKILNMNTIKKLSRKRDDYCYKYADCLSGWYRKELLRYVKEVLLDKRFMERPYIEPSQIRRIVNLHTSGKADQSKEIGAALKIEWIHRAFID
jgi:asparagine synthase (glutamine-hydrolysing)